MIDWNSILSVFDGKLTLLQWLKQLEGALKNASVKSITVTQTTPDTAKFTLNLADGTTVESDTINLPRGANGTDGKDGASITGITTQGSREINGYTETEIDVALSDSPTPVTFTVSAKNGAAGANGTNGTNGKDGNGIVSITTIGTTQGTGQYEGYTATNINLDTDEETMPFIVYARNGASLGAYVHHLTLSQSDFTIYTIIINTRADPYVNANEIRNIGVVGDIMATGRVYVNEKHYSIATVSFESDLILIQYSDSNSINGLNVYQDMDFRFVVEDNIVEI